jgi:hypothetical protein
MGGKQRWECQSQIRKFLDSFRYRKSATFLGMPVRKPQIRKFLWIIRTFRKFLLNTSQLCLNPFLIVVLLHDFL